MRQKTRMDPFQLWLPAMGPSPRVPEVQEGVDRAFRAWNGEDRVWLLPWVNKPKRWQEEKVLRLLAVPSEIIDYVDVFHVGQDGYVWGPGAAGRFPNSQVNGLLEKWLNLLMENALPATARVRDVSQIHDSISLKVPTFNGDRVTYVEESFEVTPGPFFPLAYGDQRGFAFKWPPDGLPGFTLSPDAAAYRFYEQQPPQGRSLSVSRTLWPEPFRSLAPQDDGMDLLYHQAMMVNIVRESRNDACKARAKAHDCAAPYVKLGWSTREHSYCWPKFVFWWNADGGKASFEGGRQTRNMKNPVEAFFLDEIREPEKFTVKSWQEACDTGEWRRKMGNHIKIKRAWGMLGLFWTLLLEQLDRGGPPTCGRCQRVLQGRKQFCGPEDDSRCYRQRRAEDKKRERKDNGRR